MPIYEYETVSAEKGCRKCLSGFEVIQGQGDPPVRTCPQCGQAVKKIISWCRAAVVENSAESSRVERQIASYEKDGMWSHAAELADIHSEKIKDTGLKMRALDDYKKAGHEVASLEKHAKNTQE